MGFNPKHHVGCRARHPPDDIIKKGKWGQSKYRAQNSAKNLYLD